MNEFLATIFSLAAIIFFYNSCRQKPKASIVVLGYSLFILGCILWGLNEKFNH